MDADRQSPAASTCVACKEGVPRSLVWGTPDTYVHNYGGNPGTVAPCKDANVSDGPAFDAVSWIKSCDRLFDGRRDDGTPTKPSREFAYQQMRQLAIELLSQLGMLGTHLGDNHLGGHDEEPDQAPQRELHHGDEEQCHQAPVPRLWSKERDDEGGRRVLPLDSVPVVRLAQRAEGDVARPDSDEFTRGYRQAVDDHG